MGESKREKVTIGRIWGIIYPMLLYLGITIVIEMIAIILIAVVGMVTRGITHPIELMQYIEVVVEGQVLLLTLLAGLGTAPVLYFFYRRDIKKDKLNSTYIKYKPEKIRKYLLIIPFGIFNMIWANLFVSLLELIMPEFMLKSYASTETAIYGSSILLQFITAGIVAPIVEEMIFRGLIYKRLKKMTGVVVAAILSSLLFGIFHGNWVQAPYAMILGLVCVFVFEMYKSVIAPIILHMSANSFAVFIVFILSDTTSTSVEKYTVADIIGLILVLVITAILAAITGLIIYFIVHPDKAEEKAQTTSDIHEENTINHPSELNGKCQMEKPGNTTYYEKEQQKEIVDMKNTFYYQKQDNHSKGDNEN